MSRARLLSPGSVARLVAPLVAPVLLAAPAAGAQGARPSAAPRAALLAAAPLPPVSTVPEPASVWLLGAGAAALAVYVRRRRVRTA